MKKNNGYTLVELIIVIAIMAILSGMSFVTINIIKQARYNAAISTLSNQMGSLLVKTRALSEAKDGPLCMKIQYNEDEVNLSDGTYLRPGSYTLTLGYHNGTSFVEKESGKIEASLPNIVKLKYTSDDKTSCDIAGLDESNNMIIEFDKATGGVRYGAGSYQVIYNGRVVGTVNLDATTGNHYIK